MYSPNNIRFRIVSSAAIAQFKQDQAFDFNELINNEAYKFSAEARETLLLNYELWFKFICRLERLMIRTLHSNDKLEHLTETIEIQARDIMVELDEVIKSHPSIFNAGPQTLLIQKAHQPYIENFYTEVRGCKNDTMYLAFPKMVTTISNNLHNLLLILHEVDNLVCEHQAPFLSFTDEVFPIWDRTGVCPLQTRSQLYYKEFDVNEFHLKNYRGVPVPQACFENLGKVGIKIIGIDDLDDFDHDTCTLPDTHKIVD